MKRDRVLIVDDEADISLILKLQLEDAGYTTVRAHDGIEALEYIAREQFDLVLLDIKMPRLNGIQVLERAHNDFPNVAVVMMTAHGNESLAVEAMQKGASDYIAKPFSSDEAVKKVERAIAFNRARLENLRLEEELAREKEDFVSMLSHDLKSPITAIVGSLDLVREARIGPVNPDQREFLDSAVDSCAEMVEMIDTLLDVYKFEAGKMKMAFKPDDPNSLLQKILARYQPVATRAQITLKLELSGKLPQTVFDRTTMTRLLANLLSNAFKFTAENGTIVIQSAMVLTPSTAFSRFPKGLYPEEELPKDGSFLAITVEDSGVGIPSDALTTIFNRYAQAQNRRKGKTRGTGLGLAFCRKVMDAHCGYLWVESEEGRGSTFGVLIPAS